MKLKIKSLCLSLILLICMSASTFAEEATIPLPAVFSFTEPLFTVTAGQKIKLEPTVPDGETVVKWKTSKKRVAKVFQDGTVKGVKKGTAKITAISSSGAKIVCKVKVLPKKKVAKKKAAKKKSKKSSTSSGGGGTVYWTPNGEVYHSTAGCPTLSRSKTVYSGTVAESGKSRACKVCCG